MANVQQLNDALAANYMLVDLQLRSWIGKKTDKLASSVVTATKGAIPGASRVVKNLLAGADAELQLVQQIASSIRTFVYAKTLPWSGSDDGNRRGPRLIAATRSFEFLKELAVIKRDYDAAVAKLQTVWGQRIQEARHNLGGLEAGDDYPTPEQIPDRFSVMVDLRPVPSMADFSRVSVPPELAAALGQRHAEVAEQQVTVALDDLKRRLLERLQVMSAQLNKAGKGEKTRLYDSLVTNLQEVVELARTMNVRNNPELTALADKIEQQLLQRPVDAYRVSTHEAAEVGALAAQLAVDAALEDIWK